MAKTFAEYQAEHTKDPFPLPMPDGTTVLIPQGSADQQREVRKAVAAAAGDQTQFTGLDVIVGKAAAEQIAEAWGKLPPEAWTAAMNDMRERFGQGNSDASPPS